MPKKVFVVEDNSEHLEAILFILEGILVENEFLECLGILIESERNFEIITEDQNSKNFESKDEIIESILNEIIKFKPNLISFDQIMPIRGTEMYNKILERNQENEIYHGPILFTTVAPYDNDLIMIHDDMNIHVLSKPFNAEQLRKTIIGILEP